MNSFNRTSMEQKQYIAEYVLQFLGTFNRTSMEQKHWTRSATRQNHQLLIEPVWNRNRGVMVQGKAETIIF